MLLNVFKSLVEWLLWTLGFCLIIGLLHMFSREITLDSVRHIDFRLIQDFSKHYNFEESEDRKRFKLAIGNLSGVKGKAFYPIAMIGEGYCIENGSLTYLCAAYPDLAAIEADIASGKTTKIYDTTILETAQEKYYYIEELPSHPGWLIGEAGKYLAFPVESPMRHLTFLKNAHFYLTDNRGRSKLWQKNLWSWATTLFLSLIAWAWFFQRRLMKEKEFKALYIKQEYIESALSEKNHELAILRIDVESLNSRIESEASQDEKELLELALTDTQAKLAVVEHDYLVAAVDRDKLSDRIVSIRKTLKGLAKDVDIESVSSQLAGIKSLWQNDFGWTERYDVEVNIASAIGKRTPFTLSVAFAGLERYLKNKCKKEDIEVRNTLEARIDRLRKEEKISESNKMLLHEARIARNSWLHDGKYPKPDLVHRLLRFLKSEGTTPVI